MFNPFSGFQIGQIVGLAGDITENAVRTAKNHPKGIGMAFVGLDLAATFATSRRGQLAPNLGSSLIGQSTGLVGMGLGALSGVPGGALIGGAIGDQIGRSLTHGVLSKTLAYSKTANHANVGGNYTDTDVAYTMRQRSSIEMSRSMLNARHWLGSESKLYHT